MAARNGAGRRAADEGGGSDGAGGGGVDGVGGGQDGIERGGIDRRRVLGAAAAVAGAVGLGAAVAGCSDNSGGGSPAGASGTATAGSPSAQRASGTVAEEDLPGDDNWRIITTSPAHSIEGYADKVSVVPGESVGLRVSTASPSFRVTAYRMGYYAGSEARRVWQSDPIPGKVQRAAQFDSATRTVYTTWQDSLTVRTTGWPEGAYLLRLDGSDGHKSYVPLIVRSTSGRGKLVLMHARGLGRRTTSGAVTTCTRVRAVHMTVGHMR